MPRYFASFDEKGSKYTAVTPLRNKISEVEKDVRWPAFFPKPRPNGKDIAHGTIVLVWRATRKNPVIHGVYQWKNGLVKMGDKNLASRLQALTKEE